MKRTEIQSPGFELPKELQKFLSGSKCYDSSCSKEAKVIYFDKGPGYFLKKAPRGELRLEAELGAYFAKRKLAPSVISYISGEYDLLLTERLRGEDATHEDYLKEPKRLAKKMGEILRELHESDFSDCPVQDRLAAYYETLERNYIQGAFDLSFGKFKNADEAYKAALAGRELLSQDTLIHGDFCLPNFLFDNWRFTGFIDLAAAGVGDRHIDLFWGAFTLNYNLGTDKYTEIFFDSYGRERINPDAILTVSACEVFG